MECHDTKKKHDCFTGGCTHFTCEKIQELQLDQYDTFAMTWASEAYVICQSIIDIPFLPAKPVVTNACSGCGGNSIQFACCEGFSQVTTVEMNTKRFEQYLKHNVTTAKQMLPSHDNTHVELICRDHLQYKKILRQDVVFLDIPWGGPKYHTEQFCVLALQVVHVADIVIDLYKDSINPDVNNGTKCVVMTAQLNFHLVDMQDKLSKNSVLLIKLLVKFRKWNLHIFSFYT